ncbi:MAG: NACHT domain-containing protein [Moorea sp. SIO2B7]|nr:NACHT domain-containing protein [Moorena sp. SIO2B7]
MEELLSQIVNLWYIILEFFQNNYWIVPGLAIAIALLTIGRKSATKILRGFVQQMDERLNQRLNPGIDSMINQLKGSLSQLCLRFTSPFVHQYYQSLINLYDDLRGERFRLGFPLLDLDKVFVPLRLATEMPLNEENKVINRQVIPNNPEIWDFLALKSEKPVYGHIAVIGDCSGKTTLLQHLTLTYAKNTYYKHKAPELIPILLNLRYIHRLITNQKPTLPALITKVFRHKTYFEQLNPPPNWFEEQLRNGKCLVMLDGLDEVTQLNKRQQVSQWINQQIEAYSTTAFILTSRPHGYYSAPVPKIETVLEIQPYNLEQIEQFIHDWYLQTESMNREGIKNPRVEEIAQNQAHDLRERISHNPNLGTMARNPLLLTMIATIHSCGEVIPESRVKLYGKVCDLLLEETQKENTNQIQLTPQQHKSILQWLALELIKQNICSFTLAEERVLLKNKLTQMGVNSWKPEEFLKQSKTFTGLIVESEPEIYEFIHQSFQEYLAAVQIQELNQDHLLSDNFDNAFWSETIRFYAAENEANNLIRTALLHPTVESFKLAYHCLEESLNVKPSLRQKLEERLALGLKSNDPAMFKLAAEVSLSRRLNNLLQINDYVSIDPNYLNCAEYQLFIDQKRNLGEYRQPDHWTTNRFATEYARMPITGVRASDAEEFCQWLTQCYSELGFRYRLPSLSEAQRYPAKEKQVGCWCKSGDERAIAGIENNQWLIWQTDLAEVLKGDPGSQIVSDHTSSLDLTLILARAFDLDLALDLARDLAFDLHNDPLFNRSLDSIMTRAYARALVDRKLTQGYAHDLARTLESALDLTRDLDLDLSDIGSYLLLVSGFWYRIAEIYQQPSTETKRSQVKKLTPQECKNLSREFATKGDEAFNLYTFFVLIEERRAGRMSAWEGIRIVREKIIN